MRFAYLGNHVPPFSTESHVARSLEDLGHSVTRIQEGATLAVVVPEIVRGHDVFLHTQTYGLAVTGGSIEDRASMVERIRAIGVPSVAYHLDRWWDLGREDQILGDPFFRCDLVCTADGGHDDDWLNAGINHVWFPPAVAYFECEPAEPTDRFRSDVAFVGSWRGGYHEEWKHREQLVRWLRASYQDRVKFWPAVPNQPIRGAMLRSLYASVKVVVGDSCLVPTRDGSPMTRYWSDRVPETIGRGAFLLHPWVEGIGDHYDDGVHLRLWEMGDWSQLATLIGHYLERDEEREKIAAAGRAHVLAHHTYEVRMDSLIRLLCDEGWINATKEDCQ